MLTYIWVLLKTKQNKTQSGLGILFLIYPLVKEKIVRSVQIYICQIYQETLRFVSSMQPYFTTFKKGRERTKGIT